MIENAVPTAGPKSTRAVTPKRAESRIMRTGRGGMGRVRIEITSSFQVLLRIRTVCRGNRSPAGTGEEQRSGLTP